MSLTPPPAPLRLTSRPLLVASLAFGGGIGAAALGPGMGVWTPLLAVAALAAGAAAYIHASRRRMVTLRSLAVAAVAIGGTAGLGAARLAAFEAPRPDGLSTAALAASAAADAVRGRDRDDSEPITLWATVTSVPEASAFSVRFTATADSAQRGGARGPVRDAVQVSLDIPQAPAFGGPPPARPVYPALRLGDRVRLTGRLAAPPARRNPADFDYRQYLQRQGIAATLRVEASDAVVFLGPATGALDRLTVGVQRHVRRAVARHVPGKEARAVALALLVADWSALDDGTVEAFRETGLLHLLSVSGLHLVFVGLALYGLLGPLLRRLRVPRRAGEWTRALATVGILFVYVVVAGSGAPVVRAFVMASVLVVGRAMERRVDTLNGLGLAALVVLMLRPTALFEVGFQLSFGAVAALVALTPTVTARLPEALTRTGARAFVTSSVVASAVATLATAPVLLATFGRVPLAGVVLNLPAIPLTSGALGGSLGAALCGDTWPAGADLFGAFAAFCVRALLAVSGTGAEALGGLAVEQFVTSPAILAALVAGVLVLAFWRRRGVRVRLALAAMACLVLAAWTTDTRPALDAVFLDVGQGDATLIRFPNGHAILIDAGDRTERRDEGERTVVPHLARYGVRRLDAVVATHPHADHIGGLAAVLRAVPVGRLVFNGQAGNAMWTETAAPRRLAGRPLAGRRGRRHTERRPDGPRAGPRSAARTRCVWRGQRGLGRAPRRVRRDALAAGRRRRDGRRGGDRVDLRPPPPRRRGEGGPPRLADEFVGSIRRRGVGYRTRSEPRHGARRRAPVRRRVRGPTQPPRAAGRGAGDALARGGLDRAADGRRRRGLASLRWHRRRARGLALKPDLHQPILNTASQGCTTSFQLV